MDDPLTPAAALRQRAHCRRAYARTVEPVTASPHVQGMALVEIARFENTLEAEMARAALDAAGIGAMLLDTGLASSFGGALGPARLMVDDDDATAARALLAAIGR